MPVYGVNLQNKLPSGAKALHIFWGVLGTTEVVPYETIHDHLCDGHN
jgi:hypothetical protein